MPDIGLLYVTWNRREFTEFSFEQLLANTDWDLVRNLVVYDDYSTDGTLDFLRDAIHDVPVPVSLHVGGYRSPVAIMNRYLPLDDSELFAKIDSDIVVPPGWLNDMEAVMDASPEISLLGMQGGFLRRRGPDPVPGGTGGHGYEAAAHIGGVGLMRREAFTSRPRMGNSGRFGFTYWQEHHEPGCAWIDPDLHVTCLDQIPFEPWRSLSASYITKGWQRPLMHNQPYEPDHYGWEWWPTQAKEMAA